MHHPLLVATSAGVGQPHELQGLVPPHAGRRGPVAPARWQAGRHRRAGDRRGEPGLSPQNVPCLLVASLHVGFVHSRRPAGLTNHRDRQVKLVARSGAWIAASTPQKACWLVCEAVAYLVMGLWVPERGAWGHSCLRPADQRGQGVIPGYTTAK